MRLFCLIIFCLFWTPLVYAYMEVNEEEEVVAGDHNTGMYRLSSKNTLLIKKLKQVDDILSKNPNSDLYTNHAQIEDLLQDSEKDDDKKELKELLSQAISQTENIKDLVNNSSEVYQQIRNIAGSSIRDTQLTEGLSVSLRGGRT